MNIKLINGRGQLGEELKKRLIFVQNAKQKVFIYHTWHTENKEKDIQKQEYEKF